MRKSLLTIQALEGLLPRHWGDVSWVVIKILVSLQQLFLPEPLLTLVTLKRFPICVYQHVGLEVSSGDGRVWAEVTLEALLPLMGFLVDFEGATIWEGFSTHLAVNWFLAGVKPPNMQPQICLKSMVTTTSSMLTI